MTGRGLGRRCCPSADAVRENVRELVVVQQPRSAAQAMRGVAAVKDGGLQRLAGMQDVAEVEGIEAARDADGVELVLLDGDAPGAAPAKRAEPDFAMVLVGRRRPGLQTRDWPGGRWCRGGFR